MKIIVDMIPNLFWLEICGIWDEYRKESGHKYTIQEELEYMKGNLFGWAAFNKEDETLLGFALSIVTDFDFGVVTMISSIYVKPKYRHKRVDEKLTDSITLWSKVHGIKQLAVMADKEKVAKWVIRRYKPDRMYTLLIKDI